MNLFKLLGLLSETNSGSNLTTDRITSLDRDICFVPQPPTIETARRSRPEVD